MEIKGNKKKGFTLVELICVIALLAILIIVAIPAYNKVQTAAAQRVADSNARTAYSIGTANAALEAAGLETFQEDMIDGGVFEDGVGTWTGKVNGKDVTGTYPGADAAE